MHYRLVLLRHGESDWNAKNLFTGWVDVDLSERGRAEAESGGELISGRGLLPDVLHTSVLRRAIRTAEISLHVLDYVSNGMRRLNDFVATQASGTIRVSQRSSDGFQLELDILATNAAGARIRITGPMKVVAHQ